MLMTAAMGVALIGASTSTQASIELNNYGIFGHTSVDIAANLNNDSAKAGAGPIGSNGSTIVWDVEVGSGSFTLAIASGGSFKIAANGTIYDDVVVTGNAEFGSGSDVQANVDVGGNLSFASNSVVVGNVVVGGNAQFGSGGKVTGNISAVGTGTFDSNNQVIGNVVTGSNVSFGSGNSVNPTVTGNVDAGGNATFASNNEVGGNLTVGGSVINPGNVVVGGTTTTGGGPPAPATPATPATYVPVAVPGASTFAQDPSSAADLAIPSGGTSLSPGAVVGDLTAAANRVLKLLAPGDYYFNSIDLGSGFDLWLDLAAGMYNIFVAGDVDIAANMEVFDILGNKLNPLTQGALGKNLFLETHGDFEVGSGSDWFGTVFAPDGDIRFDANARIAGALWAGNEDGSSPANSGGTVSLGSGVDFSYHSANSLPAQFTPPSSGTPGGSVPEPMSLFVWTLLISVAIIASGRPRRS